MRAFSEAGSYATIRATAAAGYAEGQGRPLKKILGAFTNPSDKRW